ncbi:MAG TPA: ABC transporter substrate-binding protein [Stellaceae bacterium]|nr:ABC transporter substrate-binding protein [Stellaceae bacterium]
MISRRRLLQTTAVSAAALAARTLPALADNAPGITDKEIKIGQTNPYSGPASAYSAIGKAELAYFKMLNEKGGISGRMINLLSVDDGYSPPKTVEQIRRLVEQEQVAFIFQSLGTPCNTAIHKYMNDHKVPQLFVATGATKWNDPKNFPWTMGWQPNYQTESHIYSKHLLSTKPDAKVGILYQNDDYGKDYVTGLKQGLGDKYDKMVVKEVSYEVTDPTVDSQVVALQASGADTFFNITTPKFAAQAIRKAYDIGWKPVHYLNNVSISVSAVLQPAGLDKSTGLISVAYYKDPTDPKWKDDKAFLAYADWMKKYNPDANMGDSFNVYGYLVAQTLEQVLKQCGNDLSRENIMHEAANLKNLSLPMLLPGISINTGPDDFAPIKQVQLERFNGSIWETFGDVLTG